MYVLSRNEMYAIDKFTMNKVGISSEQLMENAGKGCSEFINDLLKYESKIALFCGSGNNGGDGFVIARYLKKWDYKPEIFLLGNSAKMSHVTKLNYEKCLELDIPVTKLIDAIADLSKFELIIDAIFGIGLKGQIKGFTSEVIKKINSSGKPLVSIDIASGIDADTGQTEHSVIADFTLTMAAIKYGHLLGKGRENSGEVLVIDIGVPSNVFLKFSQKAQLATAENVMFPSRNKFSHKGDYGKVGIIAGSPGFTGAAILASKAALRSGAGTITLFHPAGLETIFETQLLEVMTFAFRSFPLDTKDKENFLNKINSLDVLLIGPGLGTSKEKVELLNFILSNWTKPLVLDADALNIVAEHKNMLDDIKDKKILLIPHIGEFARLSEVSISEIQKDRLKYLNDFTIRNKCSVLLKSTISVFCDKDGFIFNITGNDGLSTGGSGDVLAGIITSFIGQKLSLRAAAVSASYLMGVTAENLADIRKSASIIPSDIVENLFKY
ncbi:MAG: NAD(P)H-hydrate dehydratase [Candidatus Cloacimonetes bacterium]|nr:NAD(P)H-hydrate dehydratase [Candidatus Cloacimonadota bacterium]